uniref:Putative secreted protein n=1 Tax=Ixodes ricinus TaxID=34613 RepID=A0A6B0UII8_IXORI
MTNFTGYVSLWILTRAVHLPTGVMRCPPAVRICGPSHGVITFRRRRESLPLFLNFSTFPTWKLLFLMGHCPAGLPCDSKTGALQIHNIHRGIQKTDIVTDLST